MVNGDCRRHQSNCHGRCRDEPAQAKPFSHPLRAASVLPDLPRNIAGKKWRKLGLGRAAEKVPQFLVIFRVHNSLREIELIAALKVALGKTSKSDITIQAPQGSLRAAGYGSDGAFFATLSLRFGECALA